MLALMAADAPVRYAQSRAVRSPPCPGAEAFASRSSKRAGSIRTTAILPSPSTAGGPSSRAYSSPGSSTCHAGAAGAAATAGAAAVWAHRSTAASAGTSIAALSGPFETVTRGGGMTGSRDGPSPRRQARSEGRARGRRGPPPAVRERGPRSDEPRRARRLRDLGAPRVVPPPQLQRGARPRRRAGGRRAPREGGRDGAALPRPRHARALRAGRGERARGARGERRRGRGLAG